MCIRDRAKDKFIIEPDTGKILVSRGANLDPDLTVPTSNSYLLEVTAFDQGVGDRKRYGRTHVNVTIGKIIFNARLLHKIGVVMLLDSITIV